MSTTPDACFYWLDMLLRTKLPPGWAPKILHQKTSNSCDAVGAFFGALHHCKYTDTSSPDVTFTPKFAAEIQINIINK